MLNTDMGLMWNFQVSIITEKLRTNDTFALSPGEQGRPQQIGRARDGSLLCTGISDKTWRRSKDRGESGLVRCHAEAKAKTAADVEEFARDQAAWAAEFGLVFEKMLRNGTMGGCHPAQIISAAPGFIQPLTGLGLVTNKIYAKIF